MVRSKAQGIAGGTAAKKQSGGTKKNNEDGAATASSRNPVATNEATGKAEASGKKPIPSSSSTRVPAKSSAAQPRKSLKAGVKGTTPARKDNDAKPKEVDAKLARDIKSKDPTTTPRILKKKQEVGDAPNAKPKRIPKAKQKEEEAEYVPDAESSDSTPPPRKTKGKRKVKFVPVVEFKGSTTLPKKKKGKQKAKDLPDVVSVDSTTPLKKAKGKQKAKEVPDVESVDLTTPPRKAKGRQKAKEVPDVESVDLTTPPRKAKGKQSVEHVPDVESPVSATPPRRKPKRKRIVESKSSATLPKESKIKRNVESSGSTTPRRNSKGKRMQNVGDVPDVESSASATPPRKPKGKRNVEDVPDAESEDSTTPSRELEDVLDIGSEDSTIPSRKPKGKQNAEDVESSDSTTPRNSRRKRNAEATLPKGRKRKRNIPDAESSDSTTPPRKPKGKRMMESKSSATLPRKLKMTWRGDNVKFLSDIESTTSSSSTQDSDIESTTSSSTQDSDNESLPSPEARVPPQENEKDKEVQPTASSDYLRRRIIRRNGTRDTNTNPRRVISPPYLPQYNNKRELRKPRGQEDITLREESRTNDWSMRTPPVQDAEQSLTLARSDTFPQVSREELANLQLENSQAVAKIERNLNANFSKIEQWMKRIHNGTEGMEPKGLRTVATMTPNEWRWEELDPMDTSTYPDPDPIDTYTNSDPMRTPPVQDAESLTLSRSDTFPQVSREEPANPQLENSQAVARIERNLNANFSKIEQWMKRIHNFTGGMEPERSRSVAAMTPNEEELNSMDTSTNFDSIRTPPVQDAESLTLARSGTFPQVIREELANLQLKNSQALAQTERNCNANFSKIEQWMKRIHNCIRGMEPRRSRSVTAMAPNEWRREENSRAVANIEHNCNANFLKIEQWMKRIHNCIRGMEPRRSRSAPAMTPNEWRGDPMDISINSDPDPADTYTNDDSIRTPPVQYAESVTLSRSDTFPQVDRGELANPQVNRGELANPQLENSQAVANIERNFNANFSKIELWMKRIHNRIRGMESKRSRSVPAMTPNEWRGDPMDISINSDPDPIDIYTNSDSIRTPPVQYAESATLSRSDTFPQVSRGELANPQVSRGELANPQVNRGELANPQLENSQAVAKIELNFNANFSKIEQWMKRIHNRIRGMEPKRSRSVAAMTPNEEELDSDNTDPIYNSDPDPTDAISAEPGPSFLNPGENDSIVSSATSGNKSIPAYTIDRPPELPRPPAWPQQHSLPISIHTVPTPLPLDLRVDLIIRSLERLALEGDDFTLNKPAKTPLRPNKRSTKDMRNRKILRTLKEVPSARGNPAPSASGVPRGKMTTLGGRVVAPRKSQSAGKAPRGEQVWKHIFK
jgi:hypothetical protein